MNDFTGVLDDNPGLNVRANRNVDNGNLGALPLLMRNGNLGPPPYCSTSQQRAALHARRADLPCSHDHDRQHHDVRPQHPGAVLGLLDGGDSAPARPPVSRRSALHRHPEPRAVDELQLQRGEHPRQRLPGGVQERAAEPAGEHRGGLRRRRNPCSFAYRGPGTGTVPLPIYLAHFSGIRCRARNCTSAATCATLRRRTWTSSNFVNPLSRYNPEHLHAGGTGANNGLQRHGDVPRQRDRGRAAQNFFRANPDARAGANVDRQRRVHGYNSMQLQFRRRLSGGLQFDFNYAFGTAMESRFYSFRVPRVDQRNTGGEGDVTHAMKGTLVYELPFGAGTPLRLGHERVGSTASSADGRSRGTTRVQSGKFRPRQRPRRRHDEEEAQDAFKFRKVADSECTCGRRTSSTTRSRRTAATSTGSRAGRPPAVTSPRRTTQLLGAVAQDYGDCGVRTLVLTPPIFRTMDLSFVKEVRLQGRQNLQFRIDMLNAFDAVNFNAEDGVGGTTTLRLADHRRQLGPRRSSSSRGLIGKRRELERQNAELRTSKLKPKGGRPGDVLLASALRRFRFVFSSQVLSSVLSFQFSVLPSALTRPI